MNEGAAIEVETRNDAAVRLGMLTPSSNTVLEPVTAAMLADVPGVSAHFSRFRVTEIALSDGALGQFAAGEILRAAELLRDAKVDAIAWNGTSGSWLGFDHDERLCDRIAAATDAPATTSTLAFRDLLRRTGARHIGLVTPYTADVQERIADVWRRGGFTCVAERHAGLRDNFSFAALDGSTIAAMVSAVAREGCDAVAIVCTNMRGAPLVEPLERELGIPVYDSVAVTLWHSLVLAGVPTSTIAGWGSAFRRSEHASAPGNPGVDI